MNIGYLVDKDLITFYIAFPRIVVLTEILAKAMYQHTYEQDIQGSPIMRVYSSYFLANTQSYCKWTRDENFMAACRNSCGRSCAVTCLLPIIYILSSNVFHCNVHKASLNVCRSGWFITPQLCWTQFVVWERSVFNMCQRTWRACQPGGDKSQLGF
jgi:hypothetical protein